MSENSGGSAFLYVRRGTEVNGPFPRRLVLQRLVLGRVRLDDELSADALWWEPAASFLEEAGPPGEGIAPVEPDLTDWTEERREAWLRWIDERSGYERRTGPPPPGLPPRGPDRRGETPVRRKALFGPSRMDERPGWVRPVALVLVLVALIALGGWWLPSTALRLPPLAGTEAGRAR